MSARAPRRVRAHFRALGVTKKFILIKIFSIRILLRRVRPDTGYILKLFGRISGNLTFYVLTNVLKYLVTPNSTFVLHSINFILVLVIACYLSDLNYFFPKFPKSKVIVNVYLSFTFVFFSVSPSKRLYPNLIVPQSAGRVG